MNGSGATLKYPDFLSSAKRHDQACKVLQDKLDTYSTDEYDERFKNLLASLFYLSGYIVECSLKFKIFEAFDYDAELEVGEAACADFGINYKRKIKTHDFQKLQNYLSSKLSDVSYESSEGAINDLLELWDPIVRYKCQDLEYGEVKAFYSHANYFLRIM